MFEPVYFEDLLKSLRVRRGKLWTQAKVAQSLGVSLRTYVRWENAEILPLPRDLKNIVALFNLNETESNALFHAAAQGAPEIQNLPFAPNPFFTGRESLIEHLEQLFEHNKHIAITQPISVSGLGGIGKTQLALEYAHRCHPKVYRCVLWVNAGDKATLEASYLSLAHLLRLPEKNEGKVDRIVQAVKSWLEVHTSWLLIVDNADDLELARSFLPTKPRGHILLTTRSQIVGHIAVLVQVEAMSPQEGLLFLLRRCGLLKSGSALETIAPDIRNVAAKLVEMLGGHPLALDQAGAYIEETRDSSLDITESFFSEYIQLYQEQQHILLNRRGEIRDEHPESVTLTFEISFQKAGKLHASCADILSFCSLLSPDAIPEELLGQQTALNLPPLHFNEAIAALRKYSLIKRDSEKKVLSIHRLVQAVRREAMQSQTLRQWAERVVWAVDAAFPNAEVDQWSRCEQLLPHALVCATWIERFALCTPEAAHLLRSTGIYLRERVQYPEAEPLLKQALSIDEQHLGTEHPNTATSLNDLALLYRQQGKYEQAEPLYLRALSIREQHLGAEHHDTAASLNSLATLSKLQDKYEQAEALYLRALSICERHLGTDYHATAGCLNNLATLYNDYGKCEQAEALYLRALSIRERHFGAEHDDTAASLNDLATLYQRQGKYEQAEPLLLRALSIWVRLLGSEHRDTAGCQYNLALLYQQQGKYELAEPLYLRALSIWERHLGTDHPDTAQALYGLAELYQQQGKYELAEPLYLRTLAIQEKRLGPDHVETQETRNAYAIFISIISIGKK